VMKRREFPLQKKKTTATAILFESG
jgi:hypothetical protein